MTKSLCKEIVYTKKDLHEDHNLKFQNIQVRIEIMRTLEETHGIS
jgi:hypothetical protein